MVGLVGVLTQRNLIKIIVSTLVIEAAVNLFLILIGYRIGGSVPIVSDIADIARLPVGAGDPVVQAMVLTAIVIGLGVLALLVAIALRLYHRYGTYDIAQIRRLRG